MGEGSWEIGDRRWEMGILRSRERPWSVTVVGAEGGVSWILVWIALPTGVRRSSTSPSMDELFHATGNASSQHLDGPVESAVLRDGVVDLGRDA